MADKILVVEDEADIRKLICVPSLSPGAFSAYSKPRTVKTRWT